MKAFIAGAVLLIAVVVAVVIIKKAKKAIAEGIAQKFLNSDQ